MYISEQAYVEWMMRQVRERDSLHVSCATQEHPGRAPAHAAYKATLHDLSSCSPRAVVVQEKSRESAGMGLNIALAGTKYRRLESEIGGWLGVRLELECGAGTAGA